MTNLLASAGSATLGYRLVIDGCPYQAVTGPDYVQGSGIGARKDGLRLEDVTFSIRGDMLSAKPDVGGIEIELVDVGSVWSAVFDLEPSITTWFEGGAGGAGTSMGLADATMYVSSTEGWPTSGYLWIDGEAIAYTGKTTFTLTGLTRGALSPDAAAAQCHYLSNGISARAPEVTNWPVLWEGRRVVLFRYDEADDSQGAGTQVYRGTISGSPSFDGKTWRIAVDPISKVLDQKLGADLSQSLKPRGIHYPSTAPLTLLIRQWQQSGAIEQAFASFTVQVSGFFELQSDFTTYLTNQIPIQASGFLGTMTAVPEGSTGWHLTYVPAASTNARECIIQIAGYITTSSGLTESISAPIDPQLGSVPGSAPVPVPAGGWGSPQNSYGVPQGYQSTIVALTPGVLYYFWRPFQQIGTTSVPAQSALGGVPRGAWDSGGDVADRTIFLDAATPVSPNISLALLKGTDPATGQDYTQTVSVSASTTNPNSITIAAYSPSAHFFVGAGVPTIRLGMQLQSSTFPSGGSFADVLDFVTAQCPTYATLGFMPTLRAEDFDATRWHALFDPLPPINNNRLFTTFSPVSLGDIGYEELKAAGAFLSMDNTGRMIPARVRFAAQSELSAIAAIDETTLLTDKTRTSHEVSGLGQVNQFTYKSGFDAASGNFIGDTIIVRDVTAFGQSTAAREQSIAQMSQFVGVVVAGGQAISQADVVNLATPIVGTLGTKYSIDTLDAAKSEAVEVGQPIVFSNPYLVDNDGTTGTYPSGALGMVGRVGIVTGKEWKPYSPRITFTVITTRKPIAGYAPACFMTAKTNTSGNTWSLTLSTTYLPSGSSASSFFAAGDKVQIVRWNNATATPLAGTVVSASSNTVVVTFVGTWTPSTDTWYLTIGTSGNLIASQTRFCEVADANGVINTGGPNFARARVFGP